MRSLFLFCCLASWTVLAQPTNVIIDAALHHLGEKEVKSFPEPLQKPENPNLEVTFQAQQNSSESTLRLEQRNVTDDWGVELNGKRIARLNIVTSSMTAHFSVPPGAVLEGENKLAIVPGNPADEILVGKIELIPQTLRDFRKLAHVIVKIVEGPAQKAMPVRITVATREKVFADLYNVQPGGAAWRHGIVYTPASAVEFDVPEGEWILSATRGMEWSRVTTPLRLFIGQVANITLPIRREVDTTGFIAADTHLHTYTYSRHGDASVDERVVSLAGEGVELAVATDHNHQTDYKPRQAALGMSPYYTSVVGNEVTTANGHFNAFPMPRDAKQPNIKETNWVRLVEDIRSRGAQYVILNHPRWPTITNSPMAKWGLNRASGERTNDMRFTVDATEVVNSTVPPKDGTYVLRDWFALWNRGEHLWGVGASDTHTVRDIPGQGRTYIPSPTDDPAAIDVDGLIKQMQAGNMSVSYGIFGHATVNGANMGQTTKPKNGALEILFHVACPSWITATQAVVFLNGVKVADTNLTMSPGAPLNADLQFKIPAPAHDAHVICVAFGQGVSDPSWTTYGKYTLAVTNPIFIDANKDGKYQSPRETALSILDKANPITLAKLQTNLADVDEAIGVQLLAEAKLRLPAEDLEAWSKLLSKLAQKKELYELYRLSGQ